MNKRASPVHDSIHQSQLEEGEIHVIDDDGRFKEPSEPSFYNWGNKKYYLMSSINDGWDKQPLKSQVVTNKEAVERPNALTEDDIKKQLAQEDIKNHRNLVRSNCELLLLNKDKRILELRDYALEGAAWPSVDFFKQSTRKGKYKLRRWIKINHVKIEELANLFHQKIHTPTTGDLVQSICTDWPKHSTQSDPIPSSNEHVEITQSAYNQHNIEGKQNQAVIPNLNQSLVTVDELTKTPYETTYEQITRVKKLRITH